MRRAVHLLGELMVTAGALVALFLVWQLFWTDVVASASTSRAMEDLRADFADAAPGQPGPSSGVPTPESGENTEPGEGTGPAPEPATREYAAGDGIAIVTIPSIDAEIPVLEGISLEVLDQGALGRYPHTQMPGEVGNFAVAGHRNTWGKPLHRLAEVQAGDPVVVEVAQGWHVYTYQRHRIVWPEQTEVLAPVPDQPGVEPTQASMVLTACHPIFSAAQRIVGYAEYDRFVPRQDGPPPEVTG